MWSDIHIGWIYLICNIWDGQKSSTVTLPAPIPSIFLTSPALDVCYVSGLRSEWLRLRGLGSSPAHSYRMRMLVLDRAGPAEAELNRLSLSPRAPGSDLQQFPTRNPARASTAAWTHTPLLHVPPRGDLNLQLIFLGCKIKGWLCL